MHLDVSLFMKQWQDLGNERNNNNTNEDSTGIHRASHSPAEDFKPHNTDCRGELGKDSEAQPKVSHQGHKTTEALGPCSAY